MSLCSLSSELLQVRLGLCSLLGVSFQQQNQPGGIDCVWMPQRLLSGSQWCQLFCLHKWALLVCLLTAGSLGGVEGASLVICHLLWLWEPRCTVGDQSPPSISTIFSASMHILAYFKLFSRCFHLPLTLCMSKTPPVFSFSLFSPHSSSICTSLSVLGVWEWRRRGILKVASSSGHGRPQRGVVWGGVSHLPLRHLHQPDSLLLVWGGRHLQPLPDKPETNQGHP